MVKNIFSENKSINTFQLMIDGKYGNRSEKDQAVPVLIFNYFIIINILRDVKKFDIRVMREGKRRFAVSNA